MAYYQDDEDNNQQPGAAAQAPSAPSGQQSTGQSSVISGGAPSQSSNAASSSAPASSQTNPGNFVGIQQYLDANKTQASKLGDQVSNVVNSSVDLARNDVNALNTAAQQQIQPTQSLGEDILGRINSSPQSLSDTEKQNIKNTQTAQYKGPTDSTGLGDVYTQAQKSSDSANENLKQTGTESGRMNLVTKVNTAPRTQGENVFDNALLTAGGGREKLLQTAQQNADVKNLLPNANTQINNQAAAAQTTTQQAQQGAQSAVQTALSNWINQFNPKVAQAQQNLVSSQNALIQDVGDDPYSLSAQDLALLGLSQGQRVYGADLNSYIKQANPSDITAANIATPEDYARYGALADLAGETNPILNQSNASQAGTAPNLNINTQKLQNDIAASQTKYEQDYKTTGSLTPFIQNVGGNGGNFQYYGQQFTPEYIENTLIPQLNGPQPDWAVNIDRLAASNLTQALAQWRANQGYNNVIKTNS